MSAETDALQAATNQLYLFLQETKKSNVHVIWGEDTGAQNHITLVTTPVVLAWSDDLVIMTVVAHPSVGQNVHLKVSDLPEIPVRLPGDMAMIDGDIADLCAFKIVGSSSIEGPHAELMFLGPEAMSRRVLAIPQALAPLSRNDILNRYELALANAAALRAANSNASVLTPKSVADASAWGTLANASPVAWDWADKGFMAELIMDAARQLALPTGGFPGATGILRVKPGGARALTFGEGWVFDSNTAPTGSLVDNVWDFYHVTCLQLGAIPRWLVTPGAMGVTL